ncbi:cellulose biosynthesis protein BcsD [Roseococcus sp. DSY-14]|uniref:cellulose biosynthesis protein BcsD n=1 Tax=Roseococcus sp. DSY-14 TaxID=3369650 RepID=UPI00387B6AEB
MTLLPTAAPPPALPPPDTAADLAWLARRAVPAPWRVLLGALLEALPGGAEARAETLRAAGARLAAAAPLPPCATLEELERRVNDALAAMDWGHAAFFLELGRGVLVVRHRAAPCIPTAEDPQGAWVAAVLEGLHEAWLAGQAQLAPAPRLRRLSHEVGCTVLATG